MDIRKPRRARTYLLLAFMVTFGSLGNVLLRGGMKPTGGLHVWTAGGLARFFLKSLESGTIWLGIGMLLLFFLSYLLVLSWADYSYVTPASAVGYAVVVLLGYALLGERVTPRRWVGVAFISAGVTLVGSTAPSTKGER